MTVLGQPGSDCALFTLPLDDLDAPFTVKFKANQFKGFMNSYNLSVRKGNTGNFQIDGTGPGLITQHYVHGDDLLCSSFWARSRIQPSTGSDTSLLTSCRIPVIGSSADQPFCTFAVQLSCNTRVTNGYNTAEAGYGPTEYLLGLQKALPEVE